MNSRIIEYIGTYYYSHILYIYFSKYKAYVYLTQCVVIGLFGVRAFMTDKLVQ